MEQKNILLAHLVEMNYLFDKVFYLSWINTLQIYIILKGTAHRFYIFHFFNPCGHGDGQFNGITDRFKMVHQ